MVRTDCCDDTLTTTSTRWGRTYSTTDTSTCPTCTDCESLRLRRYYREIEERYHRQRVLEYQQTQRLVKQLIKDAKVHNCQLWKHDYFYDKHNNNICVRKSLKMMDKGRRPIRNQLYNRTVWTGKNYKKVGQ